MDFQIDSSIFEWFPGIRFVVAITHGVQNDCHNSGVDSALTDAWSQARSIGFQYTNPQSHPRVEVWGERMKSVGSSRKHFPSSIESILRRAMKAPEPFHINPIVDFYNSVSLRHIVPVGGFDIDQIKDLQLRFSEPGDIFQELSSESDTAVPVPAGEIVYADGSTVLTRHFVWRQSKIGAIHPNTQNVLLVSEILKEVENDVVSIVAEEFQKGMSELFSVDTQLFILDKETCSCTIHK